MNLNQNTIITIVGGSGFVGRHIVRLLAKTGARIRIAVRRPNEAIFLKTAGVVGQVTPVQANIRDENSLKAVISGSDIVINLVGLLHSSGKQTFDAVHVTGAETIGRLCAELNVKRLIHMSALGSDLNSESAYARTKAQAEQAVLKAYPSATIVKPSVIFGEEDQFTQRFANIISLAPVIPVFAGGKSLFSPVYVADVAKAFKNCLEDDTTIGKTYILAGSETLSLRQIWQDVAFAVGKKRILISVAPLLTRLFAVFTGLLPSPILTLDQAILLEKGSYIKNNEENGLTLLGITPTSFKKTLPSLIERFRKEGQYNAGKGFEYINNRDA